MNRRSSIRRKTVTAILVTAVLPALILSAANLNAMFNMRRDSVDASDKLGERAATDSAAALTAQIQSEIDGLAESRAAIIDAQLTKVQEQTLLVARQAEYILAHAGDYAPRPIGFLTKEQENTTTPAIRLAPGVALADVASEIELMGNIVDAERNIETVSSGITASYIGLESGLSIIVDKGASVDAGDYDPRERGWYKAAKAAGGVIWTDIFPDADGRGSAISCAAPFYHPDGRLAGVASSGAILSSVAEVISLTKVGETGWAYLRNGVGGTIFSSAGETSDYAEAVFSATHPLSVTDWTVGVVIPRAEAIAPVTRMEEGIMELRGVAEGEINGAIRGAVIIAAVVLAAAVLLAAFMAASFATRITKPITTVTNGVGKIAAGDLDTVVSVDTNDEIGILAEGVNAMTAEIKRYIANLGKVTAEKERIGAELNVATTIQESMLPSIFPMFDNRADVDLYASMLPAKEVGGDFYDFFFTDDETLAVVIADVSGKGVPAALFMVIAKTLIRNTAQNGKSPKEVFEIVNNMLGENNTAMMFVTAFMGYMNLKTGEMVCVNAGHNPPLISRGGVFERLKLKAGLVLAGRKDMRYTETVIKLSPGDRLYLYTDGVTEAVDTADRLWGDEAFTQSANRHIGKPLKDLAVSVKADIDAFAAGAEQSDDITMLILHYKGGGGMNALTIQAQIGSLPNVQDFIEERLNAAGFALKAVRQVLIAAEEIFVNIVNYSGAERAEITVTTDEDGAVITFADGGVPYNPLERQDPDVTLSANERQAGGLGIYMTKRLTDGVEYEYAGGKNVLRIKKSFNI